MLHNFIINGDGLNLEDDNYAVEADVGIHNDERHEEVLEAEEKRRNIVNNL